MIPLKKKSDKEPEILMVPIELANAFIMNPLNALRDHACIATSAITPFFTDFDKLDSCVEKAGPNPFDSRTREFNSDFLCDTNFFRYMHVDLGWKKDGLGIAMCHIPYWKNVREIVEDDKTKVYENIDVLKPYIVFDFVGRIVSENQQEILISTALDLIFELSNNRGFYIHLITFDRCESVQSIQSLREAGFNASHLSVDRTATKVIVDYKKNQNLERRSTEKQYNSAFECFRYAVQEERVQVPFHDDFRQETRGLEYISQSDKVIKSPHSSDDLISAISGAAYNASNNEMPDIFEKELPKELQDRTYERDYPDYGKLQTEESDIIFPNHSIGII